MLASTQALKAFLAFSLAAASGVHAQQQPSGGARPSSAIYSCTDARGRTITADRPIADCIDREQRELNPSGTTRRKVEPTYTAREQAEREERERQAQLQAARLVEERRRERALLVRYPTPVAHDRERAEALVQIDVVIQAARKRLAELGEDRKRVDDELEFYKKDPAKAPDALRRRIEDIARSVAVQNRFIGEQEDEKKRVNARFDEEQAKLAPLWAANTAAAQKSK
ncbi:DUF4124 domain-containing protein [Variovorax saccharolyticus]|uniref:DUF4124 domain-containing protein n=1 Tax=Variovorax saccharolyticus TaxID=3053516 RepID=UPI00257531B8|nr:MULTISPECIES: DUF4124 domain-containing protein [unclassified Variovorax]MDM0017221.1 DUF4124 domain-containing protein [Variovorax sp. J22R187]MDM0026741.1 DUF4124 domain-containing protein [Variovorax sp. J31P216]